MSTIKLVYVCALAALCFLLSIASCVYCNQSENNANFSQFYGRRGELKQQQTFKYDKYQNET